MFQSFQSAPGAAAGRNAPIQFSEQLAMRSRLDNAR
jgi:hypothetical protein